MRRFLTPRWLALHVAALLLVAVFLALGGWQLRRAGDGSDRSLAYAVEWPVFAAFVVFMWIREIRSAWRTGRVTAPVSDPTSDRAPEPTSDPVVPPEAGARETGKDRAGTPPPVVIPRYVPPADTRADQDPDLVGYNQYLARLAGRRGDGDRRAAGSDTGPGGDRGETGDRTGPAGGRG